MSFFQELKRRNVFRVAVAYLALAWLLTEVAGTLLPGFGVPEWAFRFIVIALLLGFFPVLIFSWAFEITPEGVKRDKEVVRDASTEQRTARRLDYLTIGLIVVASAFVAADRFWPVAQQVEPSISNADQAPSSPKQESTNDELPPDSIAVLPFANRSDNPKDIFFVDGIHDDLLTYVSQIGSLKVISRTSVMEYRDTLKKIPEIARELDVAHVLEGGVQRSGDHVRINVQLIDARTDGHLWSQIYDRQLTASNIFSIQSEIAGSIAEALRAELTTESRERITSVPTEDLEALEAYFLGRQSMSTRRVADLAEAVRHFERAVTLDPRFALAHANLAIAYGLYQNYASLPKEEWLAKGQISANRALQLKPQLAEAHTSEGLIKWYRRDFEGAEAAFKLAIELNPNEARAHQWYGRMLGLHMGQIDKALKHSEIAVTLDPQSAIIRADYGDVLNRAGLFDAALEQFQHAVTIEPLFSKGHRLIGDLAMVIGEPSRAIASYRKSLDIEPSNWRMSQRLGSIYLFLGDEQMSEYWFELAFSETPPGFAETDIHMGRLYLHRGDIERARKHFNSAFAANTNNQLTLYYLVNLDLAESDFAGALDRIRQAFPDLFNDEPTVTIDNHVVAIQLAAMLAATGETGQMEKLLDLAWEDAKSYGSRHYEDEAAIHALRGDKEKALEALRSVDGLTLLYWSDFVNSHPAFAALLDEPGFMAINEGIEAEKVEQLARVRQLEARSEIAPLPKR